MTTLFFKKSIIPAVTIGSILEYYELGLFIYWTPIISNMLYDSADSLIELIDSITAIIIGLFARPLGAYLFGKSGDKEGRQKAFTLAVVTISIPTFAIGFVHSFANWSLFGTIYLGIMKIFQGVPAGGELPGAICYLAEDSKDDAEKKYSCSYALVGPQIGLLFSLTITLLLQRFLPENFLKTWGWRATFFSCGLLGFIGYILRKKLHETHEYSQLKSHHQVIKHPLGELFSKHKEEVLLGYGLSIFEIVAFGLLTVVPVIYFERAFGLTKNQNLIINISTLGACALLPPFIGKLAQTFHHRKVPLLEISALGFVFLSPVLFYSLYTLNLLYTLLLHAILVILFSIQVALLPSQIASLFPTAIRYTGIGFSFNICDGILWGITPVVAAYLIKITNNLSSITILYPVSAMIYLSANCYFKKNKEAIMLKQNSITYKSGDTKSDHEAAQYLKTHNLLHRYLAYRDIPSLILKHKQLTPHRKLEALDLGCGTGYSTQFLLDLGMQVTGTDISEEMLCEARSTCPTTPFHLTVNGTVPLAENLFDLVFSSFVLFELNSKTKIRFYLSEARRLLKNNGIFIGVTGSAELHLPNKNWLCFGTNFPENKSPQSGDQVKLLLKGPNIEFRDYYWTEDDYRESFKGSGLKIVGIHYPIGLKEDSYDWRDEYNSSPFLIIIAKPDD